MGGHEVSPEVGFLTAQQSRKIAIIPFWIREHFAARRGSPNGFLPLCTAGNGECHRPYRQSSLSLPQPIASSRRPMPVRRRGRSKSPPPPNQRRSLPRGRESFHLR